MSRLCKPVTSGAPSEIIRSTGVVWLQGLAGSKVLGSKVSGSRAWSKAGIVEGCVMSARMVVMPGSGEMGCRSIATMRMSVRGVGMYGAGSGSGSETWRSRIAAVTSPAPPASVCSVVWALSSLSPRS